MTHGLDLHVPLRESGIPWLGEIPAHWEIERTRWLFRERDERSETGEEELLTVSHLTGVTPRSEKDVNMFEAKTTEGYKICLAGDLVINTLWAWMGAMGVSPVKGIVSPAYNVYQPGPRLDPRFVNALVRIPVFAEEVTRYSKGVWSSRLRLYPEGFFEVFCPVPPIDEQRAITDYLERETARLDGLVAKKERVLGLLAEERRAFITRAVTRGLDPRAPLRDSGVPWLDEIPVHWGIWKVGHFATVGNGSTPNRDNAEYWTDGQIPWLNSSVVNQEEVTEADQFITEAAFRECHLPLVKSGSVLVGITGQARPAAKPSCCRLRPRSISTWLSSRPRTVWPILGFFDGHSLQPTTFYAALATMPEGPRVRSLVKRLVH
jgi:restriction endonuclease S subunit